MKFQSTGKSGSDYIHEKRGNPGGKEEEDLYLNYSTFDECSRTTTMKKWKYKTIQNMDKAIFSSTKTIRNLFRFFQGGM